MNLTAKQLRAFLALVEERNFTRAAQRCHLSQPAFSALIQSLELALGVRLFDRSTRRVVLTAEGHHFHAAAPRVLNDLESLVLQMQELVAKRRGRVCVAALPSLAAGWLPQIFAAFAARYPGIDLSLHDALLEPCLKQVREGEADMALAANGKDMNELIAEPLCADRFYFVCRNDHRLADSDSIELVALRGERLIHLGKASSIRQSLSLQPVLEASTTALEVDHLATVKGLILAGMGVSLVPGMTLFHFRHPRLKVIPLTASDAICRQLYIIRRADRALSQAASAFHELLLLQRASLMSDGQFAIQEIP